MRHWTPLAAPKLQPLKIHTATSKHVPYDLSQIIINQSHTMIFTSSNITPLHLIHKTMVCRIMWADMIPDHVSSPSKKSLL